MTVRSALVQLGGASYLDRARAEASPPRPSIYSRTGCFCFGRAALGDKASLYGGHAALWGEIFSREGTHERGRHLYQQEKQAPEMRQASGSTKRGARSEEQGAMMIFRTKQDELGTRSKAGVGRGITEHLIL